MNTRDEFAQFAAAFNKMTLGLLKAQEKLQRYYLNTIKSLIQALEAKDPYTRGHSVRVTEYSVNIARRMGLAENQVDLLKEVAVLHDIGKIGIPEHVLNKNGPLNDEEQQIMRQHPAIGEEILKPIEFIQEGLSIVRDHHERPDGLGYPRGIKGPELSTLAAIAAVADAFDAMTSDRPYRKAMPLEKAIAILEQNKDTQFNGMAVDAFVGYLKEKPPPNLS